MKKITKKVTKNEELLKGKESNNFHGNKSAFIIVNPIAGRKISDANILKLTEMLKKLTYNFKIYYTKAKYDATDVILKEGENYNLIICCGGDGTFHEVINGLMGLKRRIPTLCVPLGTTNDLAKTLGASASMGHISKLIESENVVDLDVGYFNKSKYFSYVASFGDFCEVAYKTPQKLKNILGYVAYILSGFHILRKGRINSYYLSVKCDEELFKGKFIFGSITNSKSVAGLIDLTGKNIKLDDGKFEMMLIREPENLAQLIKMLLNLRKRQYDGDNIIFRQAQNISIKSFSKIPWTLDGECAGDFLEANIENIYRGIKVVKGDNF